MTDLERQQEAERELTRARGDLMAAIARGLDVEAFLIGPVGKYLVLRAEAERARLLDNLATVDPHDPRAIVTLQNKIGVLDCWQQWLADAITEGVQAQEQLVDLS